VLRLLAAKIKNQKKNLWDYISSLGRRGGGKAKSLKKIYQPHAILTIFDPPCAHHPAIHRFLASIG
jgi:hypothetical protein